MASDVFPQYSGYRPGSPRERAVSALLAAAIIIIALLLALFVTQTAPKLANPRAVVTFDVHSQGADGTKAQAVQSQRHRAHAQPRQRVEGIPQPRISIARPVPKPASQDQSDSGFIHMSGDDLAAADIGKMHGGGGGGSGGTKYGPGEGPGGMQLYNADWYRPPSDAQLAGYLPHDAPRSGWGLVACQTIEHYHVDNCRILDESPEGSGFGRAVQNAAWQFLVTPPRVNSHVQVGAWVRIRIDYSERGGQAG